MSRGVDYSARDITEGQRVDQYGRVYRAYRIIVRDKDARRPGVQEDSWVRVVVYESEISTVGQDRAVRMAAWRHFFSNHSEEASARILRNLMYGHKHVNMAKVNEKTGAIVKGYGFAAIQEEFLKRISYKLIKGKDTP